MSVFFHDKHRNVPITFCHKPKLAIVASYIGCVFLYLSLTPGVPWCGGDFQLLEFPSSWAWLRRVVSVVKHTLSSNESRRTSPLSDICNNKLDY